MTTESERRDDGVIVVPSEQDDDVVVMSGEEEDDEQLVHRPVTGHPADVRDDRDMAGRDMNDRDMDHRNMDDRDELAGAREPGRPMADSSAGLDAEVLDSETTDTHATGTAVTGVGVADERRPGEPRAPLSPAGPPAAATRNGSPTAPTSTDGDWATIQAQFVDDPRSAVEQAARVTSAALDQLVEAARGREHALRQQWQGNSADTEELRTALRGYREFAGRIAGLARDF